MNDKEQQAWEAFKKDLLETVCEMLEYYEKRRAYEVRAEQEPEIKPDVTNHQVWGGDRFIRPRNAEHIIKTQYAHFLNSWNNS